MSQDKLIDKARGTFLGESRPESLIDTDLREKNVEIRDKKENGIGILRTRSKTKITLDQESSCDQCFPGDNFTCQYEDESPVNYSLKYSETESCKVMKSSGSKKKFKDYSDYAEDQPTNFSLKYAEKTCDEENKNPDFNYFENHKSQFKEYSDYLETDLDQPTDFTLKYRELVEEEIKNSEFNYFNNDKTKPSGASIQAEEGVPERISECYTCEDETPLMFSRCSSLNSLSSFVHITQSIPDDRSSVVSDFSRMPSGIISPSELPDSPTQTAPSSPKRQKPSTSLLAKSDFLVKRSVFEDAVATYRQEDTPIEFSRTTSLSSLNIESPVKCESIIKASSTLSSVPCSKENCVSVQQYTPVLYKEPSLPEKIKQGKEDLEPTSGSEVEEGLLSDCIRIDIQKNGPENCEVLQSHLFTPLHNVSPQSPNSVGFGESEEALPEEPESVFVSSNSHNDSDIYWDDKACINPPYESENGEDDIKNYPEESVIDLDSQEPLTPFEEALIEECIRWGMPHKSAKPGGIHFKVINKEEREHVNFLPKSSIDKAKGGKKKAHSDRRNVPWVSDMNASRGRTSTLSTDSFDFDSNEPLTPFEEALLEQCILLGMPQKKDTKKMQGGFKSSDGGAEDYHSGTSKQITPLETALLEQCIRLGMSQKKIHKRLEGNNPVEEHTKIMSCTANLNKLRINLDNEKDNKKCDQLCTCRRKHGIRRKTVACARLKKCRELNRSENYKTYGQG